MRRNPVLLIIALLVAVIIQHSKEDSIPEDIPQQSLFWVYIVSLLGLIGAGILMTSIRLIW